MEILGYLLLAATVFAASITAGMLYGLRIAIETHDTKYGAEMFRHSNIAWGGVTAYFVLGIRASTGWFQRNGALSPVVEQANLARIPFITTLALGTASAYLLISA